MCDVFNVFKFMKEIQKITLVFIFKLIYERSLHLNDDVITFHLWKT